MPQITKDPLGNDVEVLSLTEWSGKNQKELSENTLNQYAGYATGQLLRAGKSPNEFQNNLYSGLFRKGVQEGVFQPQDEEQTKQLFENFANKPFVDEATDLDLVSKSLLNVDSEQAARAADVYQRLQSGQQDPNLDTDLADVRANVATVDKVQQARIDFAKERGLAFIDYPTGEPGRRDVWINTQASPDRKSVYDTLDLAQGIVDPRSAMLAEEYLKTDPGRKVNRAEQKINGELQNLFQSSPSEIIKKNFGTAIEWGSEAAEDKGVSDDVLKKAPTDVVMTPAEDVQVSIAPFGMGGGPIYTSKSGGVPAKKVDSNRIADAVIKNTYERLKQEEPNNPLITDYTEEQFLNAAKDFVIQRLNTDTNQDDPTKNFVSLSDGSRVPLGSASLLPKERFNAAMNSLGFDESEMAVARATRTGWIAANIDDIDQTLYDFDGDKYMDFAQKNREQYDNDRTKIAEAYIDSMEPSVWKTFSAKAKGVARSVWNASYDFGSTVGLGVAKATNWEFAEQAYKDSLIASAENERRRGMFVGMYGGDMGMGYTIVSQAAPLLTDILITKGATGLAKKAAKPLVTTGIRKTEDLFGLSAKSFIRNSLSDETKGIAGKYLASFTIEGAEKSPGQLLRAVRRDLEKQFVAGTATATQIGTSFTRSAQNAWTNTTLRMSKETNEDGTRKYTDEQINDTATTSALYSGLTTALVERGFGKVFGEGADITTVGNANIRQLKAYSKRLGGALERGGFGGTELYDTFKQVSKEIVQEGWGKAAVQIPGEALEEFTDEFAQNVIQSLLGDDTITIKQAFTQAMQAAVVGGVYGGALGSTNKIGLFKEDVARDIATGTAQGIQRDIMDRTIAKLRESGNADQTIAALQDRMRVSQRRDSPVSESIPERAVKETIIDELDSLSEEPFDVPTPPAAPEAPPANTVVTRLATNKAKELGVSEEELKTIQPSGLKKGVPQVTRNDVIAFVNRRTEQMGIDLSRFLPGPDITAPEGGLQLIGADAFEDAENRTFDDLKNRVVVIDGLRGRVRIEDEGVILDPEDGSTPLELTPNKDLPIKDFEGFDTLLQERAAVSPRRQPREVSDVTEDGKILYGDTEYDLPERPLVANLKKDAEGNIESMHMRVFNSKGLATWVYVAGDNVPKVETSYRVRGPEAVVTFNGAVENAVKETVRRNVSVDEYKTKQSKQRRKQKRAANNAPFVSDQGQRAIEDAPDFRATRMGQPDTPRQLIDEIRTVAAQMGLDPKVFTNDSELFIMIAPEIAAGLDLESFSPQQRARAVQNLQRNGNNPETILEYLVSQEAQPLAERVARSNQIAALRARNNNQIKKHGIKPGADIKTVLENIARSAENKEHRQAAKELLKLGADTVPVAITTLPNNLETAGAYLPESNAVIINLASDNSEGAMGALLHELGHAVTDRVLTAPQNDFELQLRDRILGLRAEYAQRAAEIHGDNIPPDLRYALEGRMSVTEPFSDLNGAREMVAHFYGSKTFRDHLVRLSNKGERNLVQKFIDLIASLFSGQPTASKQYRDLANAITDLSKANQNLGANPYGRTAAQVAASRAGVNHQNRVGQLFGVPNPHSRDDLEWILHQVQTLRYSDLSNEEINELVKSQRFGMLTGENPNDTEFSETENLQFNKNAVRWLRDNGYPVIPIVGKYNRGENSFLVVGLTDQDAIDAAQELNQDSVVTNTGMYFRTGMVSPRVGEVTDEPIGKEDNYFSALLDTNGNVTTIRVEYDLDTTLDSGIRYSKQDQQAAPTTQIAKSLAAQDEFQVVEDRESGKAISFTGGRLVVNPALTEQRYQGYDEEDAADFQELDVRLAVAIGMADTASGPEVQLDFEEFGLSPDSVIEQAAYNTLTNSDLQDLLRVKEQAKQFVASAYYHIAIRNDGSNERLATAQNHIADLYRYLLRDGEATSETVEGFDPLGAGPVTTQIAERAKPLRPIVRYSRAASNINPTEVRGRTKAGKAVGTRNPTSGKATEDGADSSNLVDLASLKRNPQAYRKNALLLLEYPIVAREFPELAKEYAKIRGAVLKAQDKAKANGIKIKGAKDTAKKTLANYLGVSKAKVSGKMLEDAIENPESAFVTKEQPGTVAGNKEARARNKALATFNKNLDQIKKYAAEGVVLGTDSSKALKTYTDALDKIAKDPEHPIAAQADEIYNTLIEVTKSNLRKLMDVFPADIREIANLWYDGANIIAQQFAGDNYSLEQSSAVLAVFSPQKDWFQNVELAKRTMEIWTADQEYGWDDAMSARWLMRGGEPELKENKDGTVGYAKGIKPDLDENGEHRTDANGMLLFHGWGSEKVKAKRQQAFERLQSLKGKKLKDLTPEQQAWFIRMRAETKYPTGYPIVSPDGRFGESSKSTNNKGVTKEIKLAWGTYGSIGKAINILTAPSETQMKVISDELGDQHKVRSFYNNIVDPQNNDGHVTMDTHAIAALFWQAFSGNSREVGQNFGTANTATDSVTGVGGLYPAFAEAYRAVAAEYGMLPRQVQSITWEAVRMLFTARWKSKSENVNGVRAKWVQYQNNEISLDQAQNAVFAMATNGKDLATAVANSNDEQLGLGFPSWADVTEGPAPAGVALSRAATQLDADYMKAVESKDVGEQQRMVDEAARAAGYGQKFLRGDTRKGVNSFDPNFAGANTKGRGANIGFFFTGIENRDSAQTYANMGKGEGEVRAFFVERRKPFFVPNRGESRADELGRYLIHNLFPKRSKDIEKRPDNVPISQGGVFINRELAAKLGEEARQWLLDRGYDSVQYAAENTATTRETIILNPSQIKSADPITRDDNGNVIPLSQRFDLAKPDIRYSRVATGEPIKITAFHGGTYKQGAGKLRASKEGALGAGYYVTPNVDAAKTYAREGAYGDGIAGGSVSVFDVELKNPLVLGQFEAYPANILKLLGVSEDKAEAKGEKIMEDKGGYAGKEYQSLGVKLGYDGLVAVNANGDITEIVAWNQEALTDSFGGPSIALSRAGLDTAPKAFRGRTVQLTHWSKASGIKQTDPTEHGNGGAGKELERRREYGDIYMPRTYFGYGKYRRETQVGVNRYSMLVNGDSLYDLDRDPLDLYPGQDELQKAGYAKFDNRAALTLFEKAIKDAGYKGYVSTSYQAGVLFNKQNVTKVKDGDTSLPLAAPPSIAKSLAALVPVTPAEEKAVAGAISSKRPQELAVAAVRMIEGKISIDDYADLVEFFDPWEVKGAGEIPSRDKIRQYMPGLTTGTERAKERLDRTFAVAPNGKLVEVRIDIPTFNASLSAGDPVYAITLHEPEKDDGKKIGDPIVYTNIARVLNPTMVVRGIGKKEARDIAAGASKIPLATVKGRNATITELPADINDPEVWTEVGFNPVRSSDFVDVRSKLAVVGGSEAIMVGPRVFVRDAQFTERATGYMTDKSPRYSKALYAIASPDPESSYMVSVDDLYINNATGEWDAGNGVISRLFRASGDVDPRMFEASKYQERGLRLAKIRLKDMAQAFKAALKAEPNADLDDVNLALGSTEPTVSSAQRSAAESVKKAQIDAANAAFDTAPANAAYTAAVQAARVNYTSHRNKAKYTAEVQQAREARKNSPEMAARDAAIAAADAKYNADVQAARRNNLAGLRAAQAQAQLRLEQNSPETAKAVAEMRVAIDRLSSQLSSELKTNDPLRAIVDQNIGIYLTRSYKIHQEEGYAQRILEDSEFAHQRAQARVFFEKEWVRDTYERWRADVAYEPYTDAEVMVLVRQEAKAKDVGTRALNDFVDRHGNTPKTFSRAMTRTDLSRFMQKGEVPDELRAILGEIQNPFENALRTYGNLAQFLGTQRLLNQYAKLGLDNGWLVPAKDVEANQDKYRGYKPLVNTTDTKGGDPLAEYYAEPDVVEAFQNMFGPPAPANRSTEKKLIDGVINTAARAIGASMGMLTLGSASFFVRNIVGILSFVTANGFIPSPSNIMASLRAIGQIYSKNLEGLGADMVMLGVAEGSMTSQTMRDFMRGAIDDPETVSNQIEATIRELGTPGSVLAKAVKKSKAAVDSLATLNDQIDVFYKAMYFAHEVDVQTKANKHRAVPYTQDQIKQEAARVVRLTTQGRERVAPIFKEFGRSGLGMLFNSFFRFTAEIYRLPASTIQLGVAETKSGNPVLKARGIKRLAGLGAALSMTHGAAEILKSMFGIEDDEEEMVRASQPPYGRDGNLFITVDEKEGTLSTWDLTYTNPFSPVSDPIGRSLQHIVRGDWEKVPGTIFKGLAASFLSPQIAVEAVGQAVYNLDDYGRPLWLESDPWTYKAQKFLKHVAGNAYKLRTPVQFWKAYQAYTNSGVYDKDARFEKTSDLLVREFMPFRIQTHKFEQTALKAFRTVKKQMDVGRAALSVFNSYEDLDQTRVDDAYERYERVQASTNQKLYDYSNGLMGLGLSYSQLQKIAAEADISKRRFEQAVRYKRFERYVPSKDAMENYKKVGGDNNGAARVLYIKQAVSSKPQYTPLND